MDRFAELLDRLAYEPRRNAKIRLMAEHFRATEDPERGYALAALTGVLSFRHAKPGMIRALIEARADPVLFGLSWDYVGDLAETVALMWPRMPGANRPPQLSEIVEGLSVTGKIDLPSKLAAWLDALDEVGRWALLKLITSEPRVGVSARLAKTAVASLGENVEPDEVELVWHGLEPPYLDLFAWLEGRGPKPDARDPAPFRPPMLAHALEPADLAALDPADYGVEFKWDGIRVEAAAGTAADGRRVARLWSRAGEDVSGAFPDLVEALRFDGAIDGELLIVREGRVQPFSVLQQRLNRKAVSAKLIADYPAHIRAYDLLFEGAEDLRTLPFAARRLRLQRFVETIANPKIDLSPVLQVASREDIAGARKDPAGFGAGDDAEAVEGLMLKRLDAPYVPGRPKGQWWKWKRDPMRVDAVLMYAQRGSGKRSSFYSDFTFGCWTRGADAVDTEAEVRAEERAFEADAHAPPTPSADEGLARLAAMAAARAAQNTRSAAIPGNAAGRGKRPRQRDEALAPRGRAPAGDARGASGLAGPGDVLVPVGKAYFGFTDAELIELDRFVRKHTVNRFGPVREVVHDRDNGLVLEIAFEGLNRSTRHRSGVAMRFPRIARIRWDKPPREADRLEALEGLLRE